MAFLDNSGDIILDAVLTDTGRQLLARGDGSFRISKFALGDDEINYALYDKNNINGTPSYDIDIMNTPVFEAFTNNIASLNSRLITFSKTNLFYLPVLKVNDLEGGNSNYAIQELVSNGYVLAVDEDTEKFLNNTQLTYMSQPVGKKGVLYGSTTSTGVFIRIDQGIDNENYPPATLLEQDLKETQYLIEIDNRVGSIISWNSSTTPEPSSIDDDDMASYYFSLGDGTNFVQETDNTKDMTGQVLKGARGTYLKFKIKSSVEVSTTDYLFNQIGTDVTPYFVTNTGVTPTNIKSILTTVRITGLTTGYALDVPVVVLKYIS